MHVCWSAKEALYKYYGRKQLDFRNILLEPFTFEGEGFVKAKIQTENFSEQILVRYKKFNEYILAYTIVNESIE